MVLVQRPNSRIGANKNRPKIKRGKQHQLLFNGENGMDGRAGQNGRDGRVARQNQDGEHGENGQPGMHATRAQQGGTVSVEIASALNKVGEPQSMQVMVAGKLEQGVLVHEGETLMVSARGGNGAKGGKGGDGGNGGRGGDGSKHNSQAGSGGNGGNGGHCGQSTAGADGGSITFISSELELFSFVKSDCRGGKGVCAIPESKGGKKGRQGRNSKAKDESWMRTAANLLGSSKDGQDGQKGQGCSATGSGRDGQTIYTLKDPVSGLVLEQSHTPYELEMVSFEYEPVEKDGVLEPGDLIRFFNFTIRNKGGLTLPPTQIKIKSPSLQMGKEAGVSCPAIGPGKTYVSPDGIVCQINTKFQFNLATGLKKELIAWTEATFPKYPTYVMPSSVVRAKMTVEYPVALQKFNLSKVLGAGEATRFSFEIHNKSEKPMGAIHGKTVSCLIKMGEDFHFAERDKREVKDHYAEIGAKSQESVSHPVMMGFETRFYDERKITVELKYGSEVIQRCTVTSKCVPRYQENMEKAADLLLISDSSMTSGDFQRYDNLMKALSLEVVHWDVDYNEGLSYIGKGTERHAVSWHGKFKGKLMLMPSNSKQWFYRMAPHDIHEHFESPESGLVMIGNNVPRHSELIHFLKGESIRKLGDKEFSEIIFWRGPTQQEIQQKALKISVKESSLQTFYRMVDITRGSKPRVIRRWIRKRWNYGEAHLRMIPIRRTDRFLSLNPQSPEASKLPAPLQMLYSILCGLSLKKKISLFHADYVAEEVMPLLRDTGLKTVGSLKQIIRAAIFQDIERDIAHGSAKRIGEFFKLINDESPLIAPVFQCLTRLQRQYPSIRSVVKELTEKYPLLSGSDFLPSEHLHVSHALDPKLIETGMSWGQKMFGLGFGVLMSFGLGYLGWRWWKNKKSLGRPRRNARRLVNNSMNRAARGTRRTVRGGNTVLR